MNYISTKISAMPIYAWMKMSLGMLTLVMLVGGQPAIAVTAPAVAPAVEVAEAEQTIEPEEPLTVQDVLLHVCESRGYGEDCAKTLLGMLWTESSNRSTVIGDGGRARGYFQIHYRLHKISIECAEDLVCSADWTISYLERNHYPKYKDYAIQCHNSCNVKNGYVNKVKRYAAHFWDKPLAIEQAEPIRIASK